MKIKQKIISFTVLLLIASSSAALAAESTIKKITCEKDGQAFFASMISFSEFAETWKDVFARYPQNTCHYSDIENIAKQLDMQRQNLRKAFYSCGTNIQNLKESYYELEAEIMYLRNFVSITLGGVKAMNDDRVLEKLMDYFVMQKSIYTQQEILDLFDKFKRKYADRPTKAYKDCKDPNIQRLVQKWNQLVKTIKSFGSSLEKMGEEFNKAINTPIERTNVFTESFRDIRKNLLPPAPTPDQILFELIEDSGGQSPGLAQVINTIQVKEAEHTQKTVEAAIGSTYDSLYKNAGDSMALEFENKIKELNKIVKDTYKPIEAVTECTKKTVSRQCK